VALIVLDASVVIAQLDRSDLLHASAKRALLELADDDLLLPASAYAEVLVEPARRRQLSLARAQIAELELAIVPIENAIAERAAEIRAERDALRLPDALVLACGDVLDADAVVTGDRRWQSFPRVRVVG
jgi:predicted nucleic acid-binding protein